MQKPKTVANESGKDDAQRSESDSASNFDDEDGGESDDVKPIRHLIDAKNTKESPSLPTARAESLADKTRKRLRPRKE